MAGELIAQNTDHEGAVRRFIEQFKNKPDLEALTRSYLRQLQDVEDALFEIILERNIDDAIGVQLSIIADIVGQPKTTSDDERFRTAIRARIAINLSDGTGEDVIKVALLLLQEFAETFELRDEPPAQLRVSVLDPLQSTDADLLHLLLEATDAGGVRLMLSYADSVAHARRFTVSDSSTPQTGGGKGFASTTGSVAAGLLAAVIGG